MRVHRYEYPQSGRAVHHAEVRIPAWLWRLLVRLGAERPALELLHEHERATHAEREALKPHIWRMWGRWWVHRGRIDPEDRTLGAWGTSYDRLSDAYAALKRHD